MQNSPSNPAATLNISSALQRIRQNAKLYRASDAIANSIKQRFIDLKAQTHLHRACVYLPISAAYILKSDPQMISYVVRAFYNHDTIDMKSCRAMKNFPPEMRIYTQVTFTKCLYAMLSSSNYTPDRRIGWNLPQKNHETFKAHSLGMKIACGFEILASRSKEEDYDVEKNKSWHVFLSRLKENGYFVDNIEHSKGFCEQLEKAKNYFKVISENHQTHDDTVVQEIHNHLRNLDVISDQFKIEELQTYNASLDDDDSWIKISAEDLDNMLAQRYGIQKTIRSDDTDNDNGEASALAGNLERFLNQESEFDGVDFRPIYSQQETKIYPGDNNTEEKTSQSNTGKNIDFNPDAFQSHLKEMLDFVIPEDNWDSHSDSMSDFNDENIDRHIEMMVNEPQQQQSGNDESKNDIAAYMEQMDRELAATTIGKSFTTIPKVIDEDFDDIETFEPVDIDLNTLKNLAESYQAQLGNHGPASTLLSSLGVRFDIKNKESKAEGPSK